METAGLVKPEGPIVNTTVKVGVSEASLIRELTGPSKR